MVEENSSVMIGNSARSLDHDERRRRLGVRLFIFIFIFVIELGALIQCYERDLHIIERVQVYIYQYKDKIVIA